MQLWFARGSEVSIREQLVTQVVLGILSDDLAPGQRLPSTRELARRFHLHPNTVSAGYRQLQRDRWVEFRHGSGVYVRAAKPEMPLSPALALDQMIARLFRSARKLGMSLPALRSRLGQWLELQPPDHFLLIEPDEELRRILVAEIAQAVTFSVKACGADDFPKMPAGGIAMALPNRVALARQLLPAGAELVTLQIASVPASLAEYLPAPAGTLVGVASRCAELLKIARAMLSAAGFHPRLPGLSRRPRGSLAARPDTDRCRRLRFPDCGPASRWMPRDSLPFAVGNFPRRTAAVRRLRP